MAAVLAACSLTLQPWLRWGAVPPLLAAVAIALRPELALPAFSGGALGCVALNAILWRRSWYYSRGWFSRAAAAEIGGDEDGRFRAEDAKRAETLLLRCQAVPPRGFPKT